MKVAVIHDVPVPPSTTRQIFVALMKRGVDTTYLRVSRMTPVIGQGTSAIIYGRRVIEVDAAIVRGLGMVTSTEAIFKRVDVLKQMRDSGTLIVNPPESILNARDKLRSMQLLSTAGLPIPDTVVTEDLVVVVNVVREWGKCVIKPLMGSMGYGAVLTDDPDVAYMVAKVWVSHNQPVMIQKYVRSVDRDIRVFVVGNEVLGGIYRYAPEGSWKTNVAQGARVERAELNREIMELALEATKRLELLYAGVDIGEFEGSYVIYEVNSMPNWLGFMEGTGINPAEYLAELVVTLLRK